MDEETALKFMEDPYYAPWIDNSFLHSIEHELIPLMDYIPKTIEMHFENYDARHNWIVDHWDDFPQGETWWLVIKFLINVLLKLPGKNTVNCTMNSLKNILSTNQ